MGRAGAITALAGAASGLLFLSLIFGAGLAPLVAYFIQLPILFCGLALGLAPAVLASTGAAALTLVASGFIAMIVFVVIEAAPALILIRQALLWRAAEDGTVFWYPPGRLVTDLVVVASVMVVLGLLALGTDDAGIIGVFDRFIASLPEELTQSGQIAHAHAMVIQWADWLPGIIAVSWVLMTLLNGALAQLLAVKAGVARRPSPEMAALEVPGWCAIPLALGAVATFIGSGFLLLAGAAILLLFSLPFLFQGLGVVHAVHRRRNLPRAVIIGFYVMLLVFSWPLGLLVVLLGLAEEWVGLRRRFA